MRNSLSAYDYARDTRNDSKKKRWSIEIASLVAAEVPFEESMHQNERSSRVRVKLIGLRKVGFRRMDKSAVTGKRKTA